MNRMTIERAAEILNDEWLDETDDRLYYYFKNDRLVTHCTEYPDDSQCYFICTKEQFKAYVALKKDKPMSTKTIAEAAKDLNNTWKGSEGEIYLYYWVQGGEYLTLPKRLEDEGKIYVFVCTLEQFNEYVSAEKEKNKSIHVSKARRRAFDKGLAWELVQTMSVEQLSIFLDEPVTTEAELHELEGDDYLKRAFEMYMEKVVNKRLENLTPSRREVHFKRYRQAFLDGVMAHTNGNYY